MEPFKESGINQSMEQLFSTVFACCKHCLKFALQQQPPPPNKNKIKLWKMTNKELLWPKNAIHWLPVSWLGLQQPPTDWLCLGLNASVHDRKQIHMVECTIFVMKSVRNVH
jgi:hypothetical protein